MIKEVRGGKKVGKVWHPEMEDGTVHSVIILGGANDLANPANSAADILGNLKALLKIELKETSKVALCTLLPFNLEMEAAQWARVVHRELNELIRDFCLHHSDVVCIDLERAMPSRKKDASLWNDDVHPNQKGYEVMGRLISQMGHASMLFSESLIL
jgi:lysophospholipase L1-like esterase